LSPGGERIGHLGPHVSCILASFDPPASVALANLAMDALIRQPQCSLYSPHLNSAFSHTVSARSQRLSEVHTHTRTHTWKGWVRAITTAPKNPPTIAVPRTILAAYRCAARPAVFELCASSVATAFIYWNAVFEVVLKVDAVAFLPEGDGR